MAKKTSSKLMYADGKEARENYINLHSPTVHWCALINWGVHGIQSPTFFFLNEHNKIPEYDTCELELVIGSRELLADFIGY